MYESLIPRWHHLNSRDSIQAFKDTAFQDMQQARMTLNE